MMPWIVLTGIGLILDIFNILKAVIILDFVEAFSSIFAWALFAYFFLVVWSYKVEVEEGEGRRPQQDGEAQGYLQQQYYQAPPQGYPPQGYPQQPPQGYPQQQPPQVYPGQGQAYPPQQQSAPGYPGYPPQPGVPGQPQWR